MTKQFLLEKCAAFMVISALALTSGTRVAGAQAAATTVCKDGTTSANATAPVPSSPANTRSTASSRAPSAAGSGVGEDNNPVDAIAQCKDGLYSHAKHRRGACSRHGGVAKWMSA